MTWERTEFGYRAPNALLQRVAAEPVARLEAPAGRLFYVKRPPRRPPWEWAKWQRVEHGFKARAWYLSYITRSRPAPIWFIRYVGQAVRLRTRLRDMR